MAHKKLGVQTKGTGRAAMQFGGMAPVGGGVSGVGGVAPVGSVGTARRDMRSGYYPDDMGMRGGSMYNKGGRAFKKGGRVALKKGSKKGVVDRNIKSKEVFKIMKGIKKPSKVKQVVKKVGKVVKEDVPLFGAGVAGGVTYGKLKKRFSEKSKGKK